MPLTLNDLNNGVWIYDFDTYSITWANKVALNIWESDSIEELSQRNFEPETSSAVDETLKLIRTQVIKGRTVERVWRISPKGKSKDIFCMFSVFWQGNRPSLLVEATPLEILKQHSYITTTACVATYDTSGKLISSNPAFEEDFDAQSNQLRTLFLSKDDCEVITNHFLDKKRFEEDCLINSRNGSRWYHVIASGSSDKENQPTILLQLFYIHDRKTRELTLARQTLQDPLTGLLNRRGVHKSLASLCEAKKEFVLFYIDLDGFKLINDTFGHQVGDSLLISVAEKLEKVKSTNSISARIGGDEFIWACEAGTLEGNEEDIASQLVNDLSGNYSHLEIQRPIALTASLGIAHFPRDGTSVDELIINADTAMYFAKKRGRRCYMYYRQGMENNLRRNSILAQHLHYAIANQELYLLYQPIMDTRSGEIAYFEALLRWNCKALGEVPVVETIKTAEKIGLIGEIENWVIERAICDLSELKPLSSLDVKVSVNMSGYHLSDKGLPDFIATQLALRGFSGKDFSIELTESVLLDEMKFDSDIVPALISLGIELSIDDFGTGFSSLAYLHDIPANTVKLDMSFIARLPESENTVACVHNLINILGMKTIAEGIETEAQKAILINLGIHLHQGYYHSRPQTLEQLKTKFPLSAQP